MSSQPPRRPVQPWIPPRAAKQQTRTVYVERGKPGGGSAVAWVIALTVAQVIGVLLFMGVLYVLASKGTGRATDMATTVLGGGFLIGGILLAAVNVTQGILVILAIVRGSVVGGITAAVTAVLGAAGAWAGLIYGSVMALVAAG